MKSVRLRIAAKLTLSIGLLSCLVGALIYCLICLPEVWNMPFEWSQLFLVAAIAIMALLASVLLLLCGQAAEKKEQAEKSLLKAQAQADTTNQDEEPLIEDCETQRKPLLSKKQAAVTKVVLQIALPVLIACVGSAVLASRAKKKEAKKNKQKKEKALKTLQELLKD